MATVVFVHAHPDDEASGTSGSMARAVAEGHRVVHVVATNGDHGSVPEDLAPGETLVQRRRLECERSNAAIGTHRVHWLGYTDSGMSGWEQNSHESSFTQANVEDAAMVVAEILRRERADVVVGYDWHGGYGHPDHVKVHQVTKRAAELAGTPRYLEATMNRDAMRRGIEAARAAGAFPDPPPDLNGDGERDELDFDPDRPMDDGNPFGTPEAELHWACDVSPWIEVKRQALQAHASQTDAQGLLAMPPMIFEAAFGTEHYMEPGRPDGMVQGWFLDETTDQ